MGNCFAVPFLIAAVPSATYGSYFALHPHIGIPHFAMWFWGLCTVARQRREVALLHDSDLENYVGARSAQFKLVLQERESCCGFKLRSVESINGEMRREGLPPFTWAELCVIERAFISKTFAVYEVLFHWIIALALFGGVTVRQNHRRTRTCRSCLGPQLLTISLWNRSQYGCFAAAMDAFGADDCEFNDRTNPLWYTLLAFLLVICLSLVIKGCNEQSAQRRAQEYETEQVLRQMSVRFGGRRKLEFQVEDTLLVIKSTTDPSLLSLSVGSR